MNQDEGFYVSNTLMNSRMASMQNTCILLSNGDVYTFGALEPDFSRGYAKLGVPSIPRKFAFDFGSKVVQLCNGNQYEVFLTADNRIFGRGSNQFGQLGDRPMDAVYKLPVEIPVQFTDVDAGNNKSIRKISAGIGGATFALSTSGTVYTCGQMCGRVTAAETTNNWKHLYPISAEVFNNEPVVDVSVGGCVHLFITSSGAVYTLGSNSNAEGNHITGHKNPTSNYIQVPTRLDYFGSGGIKAVAGSAGRLHAVVIDEHGHLHGWGSNRRGYLGYPGGGDSLPRAIEIFAETTEAVSFVQVECGWEHTLALSREGHAYSFGSNMYGMLGRFADPSIPELLPGRVDLDCNIAAVYAGLSHSLFMTTQTDPSAGDEVLGRVVATCGLGAQGQLGGGELTVLNGKTEGRILPEFVYIRDYPEPPPTAPVAARAVTEGGDSRRTAHLMGKTHRGAAIEDSDYVHVKRARQDGNRSGEDDDEDSREDGDDGSFDDNDDDYEEGDEDDDEDNDNWREGGRAGRQHQRNNAFEELRGDEGDDDDDDGDGDDDDGEEEEDEDDDAAYVCLDFANTPVDNELRAVDTLSTFTELLLASPEFISAGEDSKISLCVANHYGLANLQPLTDVLNRADTLAAIGSRLVTLTFVSCSLFAPDRNTIVAFTQALSRYSALRSFTFDMTSIHCDLVQAMSGEDPEDRPPGMLAAALVQHVPSLESLSMESFGNEAIELLCDTLLGAGNDPAQPPFNRLRRLHLGDCSFDAYGFECIANVLSSNSVLEELRLPRHVKISSESAIVLAPALATNRTLTLLDLHVSELGHMGVEQLGLEAILQGMESNAHCVLSNLDVSGDDGEPDIEADLQTRLRKCLIANSRRNGNKYMKYARMAVYERHFEDE